MRVRRGLSGPRSCAAQPPAAARAAAPSGSPPRSRPRRRAAARGGVCGEWMHACVAGAGWTVRQAHRATDGTYDQREQGEDGDEVDVVAHPWTRPFHRHAQRPQPLRHERRVGRGRPRERQLRHVRGADDVEHGEHPCGPSADAAAAEGEIGPTVRRCFLDLASVCLSVSLDEPSREKTEGCTRSAFICLCTTAKRRERFKGHWDPVRLRASSNDATTPARCQITSRC